MAVTAYNFKGERPVTQVHFNRDVLGRSVHSHHIHQNSWGAKPPHLVAKDRSGSNCAGVELGDKLEFHFGQLQADFLAVTDHSRDGQQLKSRNHVAFEFYKQMRQSDIWLQEVVGVSRDQVDLHVAMELEKYSYYAAEELIMYGDERIWDNWTRIEAERQDYPDRLLLTGVEANLDTKGHVDTELVNNVLCRVFVLSLHPNYDPVAFLPLSSNPVAYQRALSVAAEAYRPHIMAHPGYGCRLANHGEGDAETAFRHHMTGWSTLAEVCFEGNTALEINFSRVWNNACNILVDPKKFAADDQSWRPAMEAVFEQTPLLNDPAVMRQLGDYIARGGLFAINGDEHHIPRADAVPGRFAAIMESFGDWVDARLSSFGVQAEQVVNTWSQNQVGAFFQPRGR